MHRLEYRIGRFVLEPHRQLLDGRAPVTIGRRALDLLSVLAVANGGLVTKDELVESVWPNTFVEDNAIQAQIAAARRALGPEAERLSTVRGLGYRLTTEPVVRPPGPKPEISTSPIAATRYAPVVAAVRRRGFLIAAAAAVLALLALAIASLLVGGPREWIAGSLRPLAASPLAERWPALSPDGRTLAYSMGQPDQRRDIMLLPLSGGAPVQLTNDASDDSSPAWSKDGRSIAYVRRNHDGPCSIAVVGVPTGVARELARCRIDDFTQLVWPARGGRLVYVDRPRADAPDRLIGLDASSGLTTDLTSPPAGSDGDSWPTASPDGRWLAYLRSIKGQTREIRLRSLASGKESVLLTDESSSPVGWTPDSRSVLVLAIDGSHTIVRVYPRDGGSPRLLGRFDGAWRLSTSRSGDMAVELIGSAGALMRLDSSGRSHLLTNDGVSPDISVTGEVAFVASDHGQPAIMVVPPRGPEARLLALNQTSADFLKWSPSGDRLAFVTNSDGQPAVAVVDRGSGELRTVRLPGREAGPIGWSANGKALILFMKDESGGRIWRLQLTDGAAAHPISAPGWNSMQVDGDVVYGVRSDQPGIWRLGPPLERIADAPPVLEQAQWLVSRGRLIEPDLRDWLHRAIVWRPTSGGRVTRIPAPLLKNNVADPIIAADPRSGALVYAANLKVTSDIMLTRLKQARVGR